MIIVDFRDIKYVRLKIAKEGKSLRDFARKIGISQSYLSQLLNKKHPPSAQVAYKIANGLGEEVDKIFLIKVIDKTITTSKQGD